MMKIEYFSKIYYHTSFEYSRLSGASVLLLVLFVPTGTQGLNNFIIVEVSIRVNFFLQRQGY
jgi:hypothetical protein